MNFKCTKDKLVGLLKEFIAIRTFAARTVEEDPLQKFKFRVSMSGIPEEMGFQKVSGLDMESDVSEYGEGAYDFIRKIPGRARVSNIVLEKGMFPNNDFENLYKETLTNPAFRRTVKIELMDKFGVVRREWTLAEAWVSKWESSDFDGESGDVAIEKLEIAYEYNLNNAE